MLRGYQGFPVWGNLSPQRPQSIPGRQVDFMIQDARINQSPGGNSNEIPMVQRLIAKGAKPEGPGTNESQNVGSYGTNLYDAFMGGVPQAPGTEKSK